MQLTQRLPFDRLAVLACRFMQWTRSRSDRAAHALRAFAQRAAIEARDEAAIDRTNAVSKLRGLM